MWCQIMWHVIILYFVQIFITLCYNYCLYSMYLRSEVPVAGLHLFILRNVLYKHNILHACSVG